MDIVSLKIGAKSDIGNTKEVNQDNILVKIGEHKGREFGLCLVCDGLGGLTNGEVASQIAVKAFKVWWKEKLNDLIKNKNDLEILKSLEETVKVANKQILKYSIENNCKVGTTITALFLLGSEYYIVNVGDSRIYKFEKDISQETEDDSYVAMKVKNKEMTIEEARTSKYKNLLLQCVGSKEEIQVYKKKGEIKNSKAFLLCSDGFYNKFSEKEMKDYIKIINKQEDKESAMQKTVSDMVQIVKDRKERDNISLIICCIKNNKKENGFFRGLINRFISK
jgi:protein phosphatase